jgi:hypothetical protein
MAKFIWIKLSPVATKNSSPHMTIIRDTIKHPAMKAHVFIIVSVDRIDQDSTIPASPFIAMKRPEDP